MKYTYTNKYCAFYQLPFCCAPATLQWVMYRNGLNMIDQELIGKELGLRLPQKAKPFFSNEDLIFLPDNTSISFGTQIFIKKFKINSFFKKYNMPLKISKQYFFKTKKGLKIFLINNLKKKNDIVLRFNNKLISSNKKGCGHLALIYSLNAHNDIVGIGDPDPPFYKTMTLNDILFSISNKIDGTQRGLFYIEKVKKS